MDQARAGTRRHRNLAGVHLNLDRTKAFLVAFGIGTAAIFLIRWQWPDLTGAVFAALAAVGAIIWLGVSSWRRRSGTAQVGDDLYYLGLLFTLMSLIWALVQLFIFDEGSSAATRTNQLVGNFGIALFSTVAGILGRVLLQSGIGSESNRTPAPAPAPAPTPAPAPAPTPDPLGEEQTSRKRAAQEAEFSHAHAEAMRALRDEVRQARDAFSHFTRVTLSQAEQTRAHTEQMVREFNEHMEELAESGLRESTRAWQEAALAMRNQTEELVSRIDTAVSNATGRAETAWMDLAVRAESATGQAKTRIDALNAEVAAALEQLAAVSRTMPALVAAFDHARASAEHLGRKASDAATGLDGRAAEIVAAHNRLAQGAKDYSEASVGAYRDAVGKLADTAQAQLSTAGERWLHVVAEFNEAGQKQREAGERAAAQAEALTERMSDEVANWTGLAERTRRSLVDAVDQLTRIVRKA